MANMVEMSVDDFVDEPEVEKKEVVEEEKKEVPSDGEAQAKALAEAQAKAQAYERALAISESARLSQQPVVQQQQQQVEPEVTQERILEMVNSDDPKDRLMAMRYVSNMAVAMAADHYGRQLNAFQGGAVSLARAQAEARWPQEFRLFGGQIDAIVSRMDTASLTNLAAWDNLVAYVRGLPSNVDKLFEVRSQEAAAAARAVEAAAAAPSFSGKSPGDQSGTVVLDATAKKIAAEFIAQGIFKSEAEYAKSLSAYNG